MIVLDENLDDDRLIASIEQWYPGRVLTLAMLRRGIEDEAIPVLLRQLDEPTFVTFNVDDFWRKAEPHRAFCLVCVALPKERVREIPAFLRRLLRLQEFRTKAERMGKVVRVTPTMLEYYEADRRIRSLLWPP